MRGIAAAALATAVGFATPACAVDWMYYLGGRTNGGTANTDVYFVEVLPGGAVNGAWNATAPLPSPGPEISALSIGNDVIVFYGGGCMTCGGPCAGDVYFGTVNPSTGTIAGWTQTTGVPPAMYQPRAARDAAGNLYLVGPSPGECWSSAWIPGVGVAGWTPQPAPAPSWEFSLAADGNCLFVSGSAASAAAPYGGGAAGPWTTLAASPNSTNAAQMVGAGGWLYAMGGTTVYSAPIGGCATGAWSLAGSLPVALIEHEVLLSQTGYFFLLGGNAGPCVSGWYSDVFAAPVGGGGGIGTWSSVAPLPAPRGEGAAALVENAVPATPTFSPTATRTRTRTPTPGGAPPRPSPTCAGPRGSATPPYLLLDRNVFDPHSERLRIYWMGPEPGLVQVTVYDSAGEFVRRLELASCDAMDSAFEVFWDGRNYEDKPVSSGVYVLHLVELGARSAIVRRVAVHR